MTKSNAERLFDLFGGQAATARELGVNPALVNRWPKPRADKGCDGNVPGHYNTSIIEAAERLKLDMAAVRACLNEHDCPVCGRPLEPGQKIEPRRVSRLGELSN